MKIIIINKIKCFYKNVHLNNKKVLYYSRIEIPEGFDVNKTSASTKCIKCHFLDKGFQLQPSVCNGFYDVLMMSLGIDGYSWY